MSLTDRLLPVLRRFAEPVVRRASDQLADELEVTRDSLFLPHFWAIYVHDGTRRKRSRGLFVWFRNPRDDPRDRGGKEPVRLSQVKRLTRARSLDGLRRNRERAARGQPPFMIVTELKGRQRGRFFFSKGMRRVAVQGAQVHKEAEQWVNEQLGDLTRTVRL